MDVSSDAPSHAEATSAAAKHTPGPWEVRWRFGRLTTVSGRQRYPICDTGTAPFRQANQRREEANARLIAAAPDLLSALRELEGWRMQALDMMPPEIRGSWMRAHAAIAKATGQ
ncbi:MAG: hypothetical protein Q8R82_01635 [Hyphomonadaceae bacterium]|nr:hypothetical protein [Hyphomonadaceae bacterium]